MTDKYRKNVLNICGMNTKFKTNLLYISGIDN